MEIRIITTPSEFRDFCSKLKPTWAFDSETNSLNWLDLEIIGFSIADGTQACYVDIYRKHKKELLMVLDFYIGESKMIVMHNASFDMLVLRKEGIEI